MEDMYEKRVYFSGNFNRFSYNRCFNHDTFTDCISEFTLAEILIVLVIIGVLTMILLPIAFQSSPDEQVMKFKKGYNTLATVIRELVTSDKYYQNGDLGIKSDGVQIYDNDNTRTYFCETFADTLKTKSVNCQKDAKRGLAILLNGKTIGSGYTPSTPNEEDIKNTKKELDRLCKEAQEKMSKEIVLDNGTIFYSESTAAFGSQETTNEDGTKHRLRFFSSPDQFPANYCDENGFDIAYKIFCMDIDDFNQGEDPFGFGIRADGKILTGERADEWMNKSIQKD